MASTPQPGDVGRNRGTAGLRARHAALPRLQAVAHSLRRTGAGWRGDRPATQPDNVSAGSALRVPAQGDTTLPSEYLASRVRPFARRAVRTSSATPAVSKPRKRAPV